MFMATVPELLAFVMSVRGSVKTGYPHFHYMAITWGFLFVGNLLFAFSYLLLNAFLYRLGAVFSIPVTYGIMFLVDQISQEKVDPKKVFIVTVPATTLLISSFQEGAVIPSTSLLGEQAFRLTGTFMVAGSVVFLLSGIFWLYYMAKLYLNAPPEVRSVSSLNLVGAIFAGPMSTLTFATGFVWIFPGTDYVMIGVGALLCSYSFWKEPKLGYVLPFNVSRLLVINVKSGVPVFTHTWDREGLSDSLLFSSALHGISAILDESLSQGAVREISFDRGVLAIHAIKDYPAMFVLVTSRTSPALNQVLQLFATRFKEKYPTSVMEAIGPLSTFRGADLLISEAFPFVSSNQT